MLSASLVGTKVSDGQLKVYLRGVAQLGQQGHSAAVTSVAFSPDGLSALTGSDDCTAILWELQTGNVKQNLKGHSKYVLTVAFSPDGLSALTGSDDRTAILWELQTGKVKQKLAGHNDSVTSVAFAPDGLSALTGSFDDTAILWELQTGKVKQKLEAPFSHNVTSVAFSPDGLSALTGHHQHTSCFAIVWELQTGKVKQKLEGHFAFVWDVAFSPDGLSAITGFHDPTAILWELQTGNVKQKLKGHSKYVFTVAFSPDGLSALTGGNDRTAILWDLQTGKVKQKLEDHSTEVTCVAFSPDGLFALTGTDQTATVWDLQRNIIVKKIHKVSFVDKWLPLLSLLYFICQVLSSMFKSSDVPWAEKATTPFVFVNYLAMLDLDSLDFQGSHAILTVVKLVFYIFTAVDMSYSAFTGKLLILRSWKRLRNGLIKVVSQFLFVPILSGLMEFLSCQYVDINFPDDAEYMKCPGFLHLVEYCLIIVVVPVFIYSQLPYICVGGDATMIQIQDIYHPEAWVSCAKTKQEQLNPGLFKASTQSSPDPFVPIPGYILQCLPWVQHFLKSPMLMATLSEVLLKVTTSFFSTGLSTAKIAVPMCIAAILLRIAVQIRLPQYQHPAANDLVLTAKLMMLWTYIVGCVIAYLPEKLDVHQSLVPVLVAYLGCALVVARLYKQVARMADQAAIV